MLIFSHTYLLFKDLLRTYFCEIYVILWDLIGIKLTKFSVPNYPARSTGDRPDGRPDQESVDRTGRPMWTRNVHRPALKAGRPGDRPTESTQVSGAASRPGGRLIDLARSTGRSTGGSTVRKMTVGWSIGRSTRRAFLSFPAANGQNFERVINTISWAILYMIFES